MLPLDQKMPTFSKASIFSKINLKKSAKRAFDFSVLKITVMILLSLCIIFDVNRLVCLQIGPFDVVVEQQPFTNFHQQKNV